MHAHVAAGSWRAIGQQRTAVHVPPACSAQRPRTQVARSATLASRTASIEAPWAQEADVDKVRVRQQLLEKQAEFDSLFESGKPMPKASLVARMRKEMAELRKQLGEEEVVDPLAEIQVQEALQLSLEQLQEARLRAENDMLRTYAEALLTYQAQLEELTLELAK